ncbi:hypothetical protein AND_002107 [Anopheles darlingi]|uniref:Uncharacterized protein n=1 Tax=Anopheles darlingi TaxID=43151 RepID=W5JP01_ANODA|nr:hypothetical protein AND_002107 [Anopheles darlingi]
MATPPPTTDASSLPERTNRIQELYGGINISKSFKKDIEDRWKGQCSASTLPVAWIDEGPGPPRCPPPCGSGKPYNIDNTKYNMENRLNDKRQCLDYLGDNDELSPAQICKKSSASIETKLRALRLRHCCERTVGSALHNAAYAEVLGGGPACTARLHELLETDALAARITCEFTEVLIRYDCGQPYSIIHHCEDCKQQLNKLDRSPDRSSCGSVPSIVGAPPDNLRCRRGGGPHGAASHGAVTTKVVWSSRNTFKPKHYNTEERANNDDDDDGDSRGGGGGGGSLLQQSAGYLSFPVFLSTIVRVRCANVGGWLNRRMEGRRKPERNGTLTTVNGLGRLPEAYRRWGCSVFIPYFASRDDIESVNNKTGNRSSEQTAASGAATGAAGGQPNATREETATSRQTEPNLSDANKQQLVKNISISRKSSRRKTQRVRVRPCLDVCQTVEQKCPYMLPGDRAPAYPTQYAGEPTFLCRDLNIEETGEQLRKSNNGPTDCCYDHCGSNPIDGLCGRCDPLHNDTEPADGDGDGDGGLTSSSEPPVIAAACPSITSTPTSSSQSAQCRLSRVAATTSTATSTTSSTASSSSSTATTTTTTTTTTSTARPSSPTPTTATSIRPPKSGGTSAPSTTTMPTASSSSSSSSTSSSSIPSSPTGSSASRALSALLRTLCALASVYRAHSSHSLIVLVAVLTLGTELVACTKQLKRAQKTNTAPNPHTIKIHRATRQLHNQQQQQQQHHHLH